MKSVLKVGAFIIRPNGSGFHDLLLFTHVDHPEAPIQIPGGTVEADEAIEHALHREIEEEAGLCGLAIARKLGVSSLPSGARADVVLERHCFLLRAPAGTPDEWLHTVKGQGVDRALRFHYRWHTVSPGFTLAGDLGWFLSPRHIPELYQGASHAHAT